MNQTLPKKLDQQWHAVKTSKVLEDLDTEIGGLSQAEAKARLEKYGANKLPEAETDGWVRIFLRQFESPLIYLLLGAALIVLYLREWVDGGIILVVLLFNAIVGTIQAGRAQNTLQALKRFAQTSANVVRNGKVEVVSDELVVPGDVVVLAEGDKIPADARIITAKNLRVSEAALTGESDPVAKQESEVKGEDLTPADMTNMVFKGTYVVGGNARAVVVATGLQTEVGKISAEMAEIDTEIPLQADIRNLSRLIIITVLGLSVGIFGLGFFMGRGLEEMFKLAVAIVVSAIPEGLPIVMTLLLATGVWRMSKRNVLVKRLQAVEALGEAQVIAVDKTGTVTKNELVVQKVWCDENSYEVSGSGFEPKGEASVGDKTVKIKDHDGLRLVAELGCYCADARLSKDKESGWKVAGDPTEAALMVLGEKLLGLSAEQMEKKAKRIDEIPFDSKLKFHAVLNRINGKKKLMVVGAPEVVLAKCEKLWKSKGGIKFDKNQMKKLMQQVEEMSEQGLRVLALAKKEKVSSDKLKPKNVDGLELVGLVGMKDGIREEVPNAMKAAQAAGIRVVMITGDHKTTAKAIAREAGIYREGDEVITDAQMSKWSDKELAKKLDKVSVFARITPEHKYKIVSAYRHRGEIVAMTGDGVNDALSLVAADLGVAMGKKGTEVAKEAADLVLLDDNFGSIVAAVEEGRNIYKNIKKVILYLFSTNLGELMVIIGAILLGWPLPVLAAQLIWLNLVTDGFLVAALAMESKEKKLLSQPFKRPSKWIVDGWMAQRMLLMATTMAVGTLWLFSFYADGDYVKATTIALTTMAVYQWYKVFNCRLERQSITSLSPWSNRYIVAALVLVISLQLMAMYTSLGQSILHLAPLSLREWTIILLISLSTILVDELRKLVEVVRGKT